VGLSGIASILLAKNAAIVTCIFMGFMLGTVPELWTDAGKTLDRKKYPAHRITDWLAMGLALIGMTVLLTVLSGTAAVHITPGFGAYILCGLFWGISFVVPGMSASTLLLFFGLYQPMLEGISRLDFSVLIPLGIGMLIILVLLPRLVNAAFARWDATLSHIILGIVLATTIMIFPGAPASAAGWLLYLLCFVGGGVVSWGLSVLCAKLKENAEK